MSWLLWVAISVLAYVVVGVGVGCYTHAVTKYSDISSRGREENAWLLGCFWPLVLVITALAMPGVAIGGAIGNWHAEYGRKRKEKQERVRVAMAKAEKEIEQAERQLEVELSSSARR